MGQCCPPKEIDLIVCKSLKKDVCVTFGTPMFKPTSLISPNGTFAVGTTITSGSSLPRIRGYRFTLSGGEITFEELFSRELTGIGLDGSGLKQCFPAYDVSGRLFIKATKSGEATRLREIDPLTGADLGGVSLTSSASPDYLEIDDESNMYVPGNSSDSIRIFDLDYNLLKTYTGVSNPFSISFAVSPDGDIAMVDTQSSPDKVQIQDFGGALVRNILTTELTGNPTNIDDVRINNNYVAISSSSGIHILERENYTELWFSSSLKRPTFGLKADEMYVEDQKNGGTESYIRKVEIETGNIIWETLSVSSIGTSPDIQTIHPISTKLLAVWHSPIGRSTWFDPRTGAKYENENGGGRGNMSLHPLSNDRIANFELS